MTTPLPRAERLREILEGTCLDEPAKVADGWEAGLLDSPQLIVEHLRQSLPTIIKQDVLTSGGNFGHAYLFCEVDPYLPEQRAQQVHRIRIRPDSPRLEDSDAALAASHFFAIMIRCFATAGQAVCAAVMTGAQLIRGGESEVNLLINVLRRDHDPEIWHAPIPRTGLPDFVRLSAHGTSVDLWGLDRVLAPLPELQLLNDACDATGFPMHELIEAWDARPHCAIHLARDTRRSVQHPLTPRHRLVAELVEPRVNKLVAESLGPWERTEAAVTHAAERAGDPLAALGLLLMPR